MEGWVEFTDARSGMRWRTHWSSIKRIDENLDHTAIMFSDESGIKVNEDYAEVGLRMDNAVEREREAFKKQGVLICDDSIST